MNFSDLFKAMKAGQQLSKPATWKNVTVLTTSLASLLAVVVGIYPEILPLNEDQIIQVASFLAAGVGVFNMVMVIVTSKKVGVK